MPSTILYSLILRTVTRDCTTRLLQLTKYCTACQVRPSFRGHCMPSTISYITRTAHSHSYCLVMARANFHNLVMHLLNVNFYLTSNSRPFNTILKDLKALLHAPLQGFYYLANIFLQHAYHPIHD